MIAAPGRWSLGAHLRKLLIVIDKVKPAQGAATVARQRLVLTTVVVVR